MHIGKLMPSKYLKQSDLEDGDELVTVRELRVENVARENEPDEEKGVLYFKEFGDKGLVMNSTNLQLAARALGSDDTDDWVGQQIVLYVDENVSFGGKVVGGLRLRASRRPAPKGSGGPAPRTTRPASGNPVADMDEDVPF